MTEVTEVDRVITPELKAEVAVKAETSITVPEIKADELSMRRTERLPSGEPL